MPGEFPERGGAIRVPVSKRPSVAPIDVIIAGGGAVGSATAYFLVHELGFTGTVSVVEPDPAYRFAASTRSAASIRQQFSTPLNIAMSAFGIEFLRSARHILGDMGLVQSTYLYLASAAGAPALRTNVAIQRQCGVAIRLHDAVSLAAMYPWINAADIGAAADTTDGEGWFDGYALLRGLRAANERAGVRYIRDRITTLRMRGGAIDAVLLGGGDLLRCRWLVNAAGTQSRVLASAAGIDLPVVARKRTVFVFSSPHALPQCPMVIDPSGLWFRREGDLFLCGAHPQIDADVDADDFEPDHHQFEQTAWPILAHRVAAFEALRVMGAWAGHYDYNCFDQNPFLGSCPGVPNLLLASGFSGHGLQHAPAVGRALAEYVVFGEYRSIDVGAFSYERYLRGRPIREHNVI